MTTEVAKSVGAPLWDTETRWRGVAREIALDIQEMPTILEQYQVDDFEWEQMAHSDRFKAMLKQEREAWAGSLAVEERYRLKTLVVLEENLPLMNEMLNSNSIPANVRADIFKTLGKHGGVERSGGDAKTAVGGSEGFTLNINFGTRSVQVRDVTPSGKEIEGVTIEHDGSNDSD
jgi:hypothetical protein